MRASARTPHVHVDAGARPRGRVDASAWMLGRVRAMSARMRCCVRADASVLPPCNFITDATVRPSHGRSSGHRPILRPLSSV
jgi:hypothetical protein